MEWKLVKDSEGEVREDAIQFTDDDGTVWSVPNNDLNRHWQAYQAFLADGGEPEEAD